MDHNFWGLVRERCGTYRFLSQIYREELPLILLSELSSLSNPEGGDGFKMLARFFAGLDRKDLEQVQIELAVDYARLFLNAGESPVYPYESVYTSGERLLMQEARDQVLKEYRAEGLIRAERFNEPEDHLAIELEFMAHLCQKTAGALERGDSDSARQCLDKQKRFLDKHLLVWIPTFCEDTLRAAHTDFYKGVARLTKDFLASERVTIDELSRQLS